MEGRTRTLRMSLSKDQNHGPFSTKSNGFICRQLLIHFLADTNIFGIDIDRNPHKADEENLILLYQPALLPPQYYDLTMGVEVIQSYQNYLLAVSTTINV